MIERTKFIPAIVALLFTFVASIVTIINRYEATQALIIILSVLVGSYVVGLILRWIATTYLVVEVEKLKEESESETDENGEKVEGDENEEVTAKQSAEDV